MLFFLNKILSLAVNRLLDEGYTLLWKRLNNNPNIVNFGDKGRTGFVLGHLWWRKTWSKIFSFCKDFHLHYIIKYYHHHFWGQGEDWFRTWPSFDGGQPDLKFSYASYIFIYIISYFITSVHHIISHHYDFTPSFHTINF